MKTKIRNVNKIFQIIEKAFQEFLFKDPFTNKRYKLDIIECLENLNIVDQGLINDEEFDSLKFIYKYQYPSQRFGQFMVNYFPDKEELISYIFPDDPDPFYEESKTTLERLQKYDKGRKV